MVRNVYLLLIILTIGFMLLHQGLDFAGKIRHHLKVQMGEADPHAHVLKRWFVRMTLGERIQHALLAISFFTLVYTGFALKFPEAWVFSWLARLDGGYAWRGIIHRSAAVIMIVGSLGHVVYLFTKRGRQLLFDLLPKFKDAVDLFQNMLYLTGLRKTAPQFDRFGYIEKMEYWALIWGTVVMTVTGLLLWFENQSMQYLTRWVLDLATVVHYYEAWLAFLAIVVWHLYQNILNPDVYPMNWTWLTGKIPEGQLRHEHYVEWAKMVEAESRAEEAAREAAEKAAAEAKGPDSPG
jgi:formate dehydrogenase gamma subunit